VKRVLRGFVIYLGNSGRPAKILQPTEILQEFGDWMSDGLWWI
jgi:hypothetical protein